MRRLLRWGKNPFTAISPHANNPGPNPAIVWRTKGGGGGVVPPGPELDNLVLRLPLDSDFNDVSTSEATYAGTGSPVISNTVYKYGGGSGEFGGFDLIKYTGVPAPGANDLTVEFWVINSTANISVFRIGDDAGFNQLRIYYTGTTIQARDYDGVLLEAAAPLNVWHHVAVTVKDGTMRLFIDGVNTAGTYTTPLDLTNGDVYVGGVPEGSPGFDLVGHFDDYRQLNGYAMYTEDFTPPNSAFPTP